MLYGLGRRTAFDDRDANYPAAAIIPAKKTAGRKYKYWNEGSPRINQGSVPACVGAAWTHFLINGPIRQNKNIPSFIDIYTAAQKIDEWPGEDYAGTSVRAGAKVLQDQGYIESYLWTSKIDELILAVLEVSPAVVGTNWYRGMSWPDEKGIVKIAGPIDGGHAYLLNGVNLKTEMFRFEQSWTPTWGDTGNGWISFKDMERLINEDGEICLATETKKM
jgi:hypothetical protein